MAMSEVPLLVRLLASSVSSANRAGQIIRDVMKKGDLGIISKGKNDLQTEADRSAQNSIVASLSSSFPGLTIIGEEGKSDSSVPQDWIANTPATAVLENNYDKVPCASMEDIVVWVDPLDGTSEYTQGLLDHVTVLIGLAVAGQAVGGVIHQPYFGESGRTIWGLEGLPVGGLTPAAPPRDSFILTTTRSHSNSVVEAVLQSLNPDDILRVGGAGYKVILLLEGKAHAYVFASSGCKKWDTCAPEAVLKCFGGRLTDIHGEPYQYFKDVPYTNSKGVLAAASPDLHKKCNLAIKATNFVL